MTCSQVDSMLSAYVDQELPGGQMCLVRAHLMHCPKCETEEQHLRALKVAVSQTPLIEPSCDFELRLRQRLQFEEPVAAPRNRSYWLAIAIGISAVAASGWYLTVRPTPSPVESVHSAAREIRRDQLSYASADPLSGGQMVISTTYAH